MALQNRIYVTLSPRMRKALEVCAALDGNNAASYAANVLSSALMQEIEKSPALHERWVELEREALQKGTWDDGQGDEQTVGSSKKTMLVQKWILAGSHPQSYEYGIDTQETFNGKNSGYLKAKEDEIEGFGTLMQTFKADNYRGKRLLYTAQVKSAGVEGWAGLWMRIDGTSGNSIGFDNMQNRPITGTTDWQQYDIVLDVPQESAKIAFGILLAGVGQVWLSYVQFAEVGDDVPTTFVHKYEDSPENLDFTE